MTLERNLQQSSTFARTRLAGTNELIVLESRARRRKPGLIVLSVVLTLWTRLEAQETVTFELRDSAIFSHSWAAPGSMACLSGGFIQMELVGTFELNMDQGLNHTGGTIENIDFRSITEGVDYHVTGTGALSMARLDDSPVAEPPNDTIIILRIQVGEDARGRLDWDPPGQITRIPFPELRIILQSNPPIQSGHCFLFSGTAEPVPEDAVRFFRRGDVNGDGKRDIDDPVNTLNHLFADGLEPSCADSEDANDDGKLGVTDAVYLLNHLFRDGALPPVPSTFCGVDPTEDGLGCEGQAACMTES